MGEGGWGQGWMGAVPEAWSCHRLWWCESGWEGVHSCALSICSFLVSECLGVGGALGRSDRVLELADGGAR